MLTATHYTAKSGDKVAAACWGAYVDSRASRDLLGRIVANVSPPEVVHYGHPGKAKCAHCGEPIAKHSERRGSCLAELTLALAAGLLAAWGLVMLARMFA